MHLKNEQEAQRFYHDLVTDPRSPVSRHPRDYAIHVLGTFDTETGLIEADVPNPDDITPYHVLDQLDELPRAVSPKPDPKSS